MPTHPGKKGGRIPPDGRPPQAKGVGKNAKRHDLERPATPGLHGSDLQKGDVQAMEQGQRIAPRATQERGRAPQPQRTQNGGSSGGSSGRPVQIPDAIDFFGGRSSGPPSVPQTGAAPTGGKLEKWQPVLEALTLGPGSSGGLAQAYIHQLRRLRQESVNRPAVNINLNDIDDGIEAMTREL